jgi:hypothetical protein
MLQDSGNRNGGDAIALTQRGNCTFEDKVTNAARMTPIVRRRTSSPTRQRARSDSASFLEIPKKTFPRLLMLVRGIPFSRRKG